MKKLIAVICVMLATSPLALAQDKAKADTRITVTPALPAGVTAGSIASGAPAMEPAGVTPIPGAAASKGRKVAQVTEKSTKAAPAARKSTKAATKRARAKKEPSAKQKAQQEKMRSCSKEASGKKLKGAERKTFMSGCMGAKPAAEPGKAPAKK